MRALAVLLLVALVAIAVAHGDHRHAHADHGEDHDHHKGHDHDVHDHHHASSPDTCTGPSAICAARSAQASAAEAARAAQASAAAAGLDALADTDVQTAALLSALLTGLASLCAVVLLPLPKALLWALLPFAAGALLADCALHLLPAIYSAGEHGHGLTGPVAALLAGVASFFALDALARRAGGGCAHDHTHAAAAARVSLAADAVHNFCDGVSIGASFLASREAGVATTLAVLAHELPQEVGDFALLLRAGWGKPAALAANLLCAMTAVGGAAAALAADRVAHRLVEDVALPFAAGGLLYLALGAIVPDVLEGIGEPAKTKDGEAPVGFARFIGRLVIALVAASAGVVAVQAAEVLHMH